MERVIGLAPNDFSVVVWVRPDALILIPLKSAKVLMALFPHRVLLAKLMEDPRILNPAGLVYLS